MPSPVKTPATTRPSTGGRKLNCPAVKVNVALSRFRVRLATRNAAPGMALRNAT